MTRQLRHVRMRDAKTVKRQPAIEQEISAAIADLMQEHDFSLSNPPGDAPYDLTMALEDHRLVLELQSVDSAAAEKITLALQPLRPVIRAYFMICENYTAAIRSGNRLQLEAIDAGRRGAHNEGAQLLRELLQDKVRLDLCTARRLFTLVAALHLGGWSNR